MWKLFLISLQCSFLAACSGSAFQASSSGDLADDRADSLPLLRTDGGSKSDTPTDSPITVTPDAGNTVDAGAVDAAPEADAGSLEKPICQPTATSSYYAPECAPWYESMHFSAETFTGPCCTTNNPNQIPRCGALTRNGELCL